MNKIKIAKIGMILTGTATTIGVGGIILFALTENWASFALTGFYIIGGPIGTILMAIGYNSIKEEKT